MSKSIDHQLFQPAVVGNIQLSNRIVMAPMTRSRAIGNTPGEIHVQYYTQRAGAGLIITEGTAPSANGIGYARTPGIFSPGQVAAWKKVTDSVHQQGGKIFVQLMHVGRIAHPYNMISGTSIHAPSVVTPDVQMWTDQAGLQPIPAPKAMTAEELKQTIHDYVIAADLAMEAGFDGIEIHAANGYLPEQFLNAKTNIRTDRYGGSLENRNSFALELVAKISTKIGRDRTAIRISPFSTYNDMPTYDEITAQYEHLALKLNELSPAYIHLVEYAARSHEKGLNLLRSIRKLFRGRLIANGGYTREMAMEKLAKDEADLISFGSPFISNPDLPCRLKNQLPLAEANTELFYTAGEEGYVDYPSL